MNDNATLAAFPLPFSLQEAERMTADAAGRLSLYQFSPGANPAIVEELQDIARLQRSIEIRIRQIVNARRAVREEREADMKARPFRGHVITTDGLTLKFGAESKALAFDHARKLLHDNPGAVAWYTGRNGEAEPQRVRA